MTLYQAFKTTGKVKMTFKDGSEPIIGVVDYFVPDYDSEDGRAFAGIDRFEIYEDEIESIELAES